MDIKRIFINTTIELIKENSFEDITVSKIIKRAQLSRSSFYRYFHDKYDVVNEAYLECCEAEILKKYKKRSDRHLEIYRYIYENQSYFKKVLKTTGQNSFSDFYQNNVKNWYIKAYQSNYPNQQLTDEILFKADIAAHSTICSLKKWVNEGCRVTVENIYSWSFDLLPEDFKFHK